MKSPKLAIVTALCCALGSASVVFGETYRDDRNHFSITMPDDWVAMVPETINMVNKMANYQAKKSNVTGVEYDAGYQPLGTPTLAYPYLLIQVVREDFSDANYSSLERGLGVAMEKGVQEAADGFSEILSNAEAGKPIMDREKGRIVTPIAMEVAGIGKVRGISVGWLGKNGLMNIHCYALADEFDKWAPTFEKITDSLRFDDGYKFEPKSNPVLNGAMRGAVIGAVIGLIIAEIKAAKKGKA